jgi:uncharacterized membrane protein
MFVPFFGPFFGLVWIGSIVGSVILASQKGRSIALAIVSSFFFGIFALIYYLAVEPVGKPREGSFWDDITGKKRVSEKLEELQKMHAKGILTDEEFKKAKEKVSENL